MLGKVDMILPCRLAFPLSNAIAYQNYLLFKSYPAFDLVIKKNTATPTITATHNDPMTIPAIAPPERSSLDAL